MSATSTIEWTSTFHADGTVTKGATWNFVTGGNCEVSPGCDHCYARVFAERFRGVPGHPFEQGFDLKLWPERLTLPMQWKTPRRIFVNSMSDLFNKDVPDEFLLQGFATMARTPWHTYQVLTKRPSRLVNTGLVNKIIDLMSHLTGKAEWPRHIWVGTSVEQSAYAWRVEKLRAIPVFIPVLFLSYEPALGSLKGINLEKIAWVICGAESGRGARPMDENWVREIRDACIEQGVAFFYKQQTVKGRKIPLPELDGKVWSEFPLLEEGAV